MKKIAFILITLILIISGGVGVSYWRASKGAPASTLEEKYLTPADRFVDVAGARIRIREEGDPSAPPVILIHGFTHSLETWDGWAAVLKNKYRVIRYDLLGHGLTGPDPLERYAPEERAAFIGDIMDALNIDHAAIAGNSLGGLAAWRFAAKAPARVDALELAGGQTVQHLIGDQQDGTLAVDGGQAVIPAGCDLRPGQPRILHRVERVARFHEPEIAGLDEGRNHAGGPQDVGHQGAVARPHLDQLKSGWRAQP